MINLHNLVTITINTGNIELNYASYEHQMNLIFIVDQIKMNFNELIKPKYVQGVAQNSDVNPYGLLAVVLSLLLLVIALILQP